MPATRRLLMVSHRAPVELVRTPGGPRVTRTVGGLATALGTILCERGGTWIAWTGAHEERWLGSDQTALPYPIRPVHLRQRDIANYYGGFANQVLWPLCHTFP